MYDWTVGAIISGLGLGVLRRVSLRENSTVRARARARPSLCGARARARARAGAATGGFFSEEVQSRAYAPPHASSVYIVALAFHCTGVRRPTP